MSDRQRTPEEWAELENDPARIPRLEKMARDLNSAAIDNLNRAEAAEAKLAEVRSLLDDPNTPDAAIGRALRAILTRPIPPGQETNE